MNGYNVIPATELDRIVGSGAFIVDVRTPIEHEQSRLTRPHDHVPLDALDPADYMLRRGLDRDDPVYILCRSGARARQAAEKFMTAGYPNVHVIDGGLTACEACGHSTTGTVSAAAPSAGGGVKNTIRVIPLERQVRIAAGVLVALGVVLGFALAPVFYLLPLFVGLGLIYAGITDRCGMGLLLAKAPWNRTGSASVAGACSATGPGKQGGGCA